MITHGTEPKPHRVVFRNSESSGLLPVKSSIFEKLDRIIQTTKNQVPLSFFKNASYTLGLSKHGKINIYVKSDLAVFPKEFLRSLRKDFMLNNHEIRFLIERLDFVELEISHKINDPNANLKNAKIEYGIEGLVKKLIAFTDNSFGNIEIELKGDPETSGNLEFLLRDKLNAILYFAELTKIIAKLSKIQNELMESISFIKNGITFQIDSWIYDRLGNTEQKTEHEE